MQNLKSFTQFNESFKNIEFTYQDVIDRMKERFGWEEGDPKTIHVSDLVGIANTKLKNRPHFPGMGIDHSVDKIRQLLEENGWIILTYHVSDN